MRDLSWRAPVVWAAAALLLLNGLGYAALASRLPELQRTLGLSEPQLGVARAGFVVGISATMLVAPRVVRRYRARRVAPVAAGLYLVSIGLAGAGFGTLSFAALLCAAGALSALIDIGQNVIAVRLEKARMQRNPRARPNSLLSPMEGLQAVGVTAGSGFGLLTAGRVPLLPSFAALALVGVLAAALTAAVLRGLQPMDTAAVPPEHGVRTRRPRTMRAVRERLQVAYPPRLRWVTAMSFAALLLEGVFTNWIAILVTDAGASLATGSLCLTVFAAALFLGRLSYSVAAQHLDRVTVARAMGVLLVLGTAVLVVLPAHAPVAVAGSGAAGLGLANLHPFCTGAVGHGAHADSEEDALGRMNRVSYAGIALESLLISGLTAAFGLSTAIALVGLLGVLFIVKAPLLDTAAHHEQARPPNVA